MKKPVKTVIESAIMSGSLGLVLITLSGTTRTQATVIAVVSVALFFVSSMADRD
jgi:hypothetical protein